MLLERRGAATALITTAGFRDVLSIGRQVRPNLYALHPTRPPALLPRELTAGSGGAYRLAGQCRAASREEDAAAHILDGLRAEGIESVAVCLLFSYLNPAHERRISEMADGAGADSIPLVRCFAGTA